MDLQHRLSLYLHGDLKEDSRFAQVDGGEGNLLLLPNGTPCEQDGKAHALAVLDREESAHGLKKLLVIQGKHKDTVGTQKKELLSVIGVLGGEEDEDRESF